MAVIASAFTNGYGSNPVISGASAINEVLTATSATAASWQPGIVKQAATPLAGYTLVNGTGAIISWTAPSDGVMHRALIWVIKHVTLAETGGQIVVNYTLPDGTSEGYTLDNGSNASPGVITQYAQPWNLLVQAGSTVTVRQNSALTVGASVQWAEIWGS